MEVDMMVDMEVDMVADMVYMVAKEVTTITKLF